MEWDKTVDEKLNEIMSNLLNVRQDVLDLKYSDLQRREKEFKKGDNK